MAVGAEPDVEVGEFEVGAVEDVGVVVEVVPDVGAVVPVEEVEAVDGEVAPVVDVDDWPACTP